MNMSLRIFGYAIAALLMIWSDAMPAHWPVTMAYLSGIIIGVLLGTSDWSNVKRVLGVGQ